MKKIIIVMAAIVAAFTMASCNKEQLTESEGTPVVGNDVITAFTESTLTKTSLSGNDTDGYEVFWSEGDTFKMGDNTFTLIDGANTTSGKFQGTLPEGDGPFTAYYPATYNGTDWPTSQTYSEGNITGSPMTAEVVKGAESLSFKNAGGILRLTVKGTATIKSITVSATNLLNDITLNCGNGVTLNEDGTVFHIAMPEGNHSGVSIYFRATDDNYCFKKLKQDTTLDIIKSQITPASFTVSFPSSDSTAPLTGVFSVSASKQVCFSKGNLRYSRNNSGKWSFFDKQYKCGPDSYVGHEYEISLFTWGYNATNSIVSNGNSANNVSITSGNLSSAQDWGSVIADGNAWRTLTSDEWHYLFVDRPDAADKCGYATVDGKKGLIILPDEFTDPKKNGGSGAFVPGATTGYNANVYSLGGNWEAMEAAGAVFLPAAGRRSSNSIAYVGDYGCYWSSSAKDSDYAYYVEFYSSNVGAAAQCNRGLGCSVRLVEDVVLTVNFNMNGHGTAPDNITLNKYGLKINKPANPTATGYAFDGWYKDEICETKWDFNTDIVTANTTIYAKWVAIPSGALSGFFTVNSDGDRVFISKGNLWRNQSGTFNFETNQYEFSGSYNTSHISHFMWSKNADVACALKYNDESVSDGDTFFTNATETTPNSNFTVNGQKGIWRTLSSSEWDYLIGHNGSVWATVNGVEGLIIFCDRYSGEKTGTFTEIPNGCLFLPAAGNRSGRSDNTVPETMLSVGANGYYWSSTPDGVKWACELLVRWNSITLPLYDDRFMASAVRLVTNVTE